MSYLYKVSGDPNRKFNPVGWCTEMAGANLAGLKEVFGEAVTKRIKTCEFHFRDHRNKNARRLDAKSATKFKTLWDNLLLSATEDAYESSQAELDRFIPAKEERGFLSTWVSQWHQRRGFIFRAFAPSDAPKTNQAEVIHARWVNKDCTNLSNNSTANAPCGSFIQATPSSSGGLSAAYNAPIGSFLHSTTAATSSFPSISFSNSPYSPPQPGPVALHQIARITKQGDFIHSPRNGPVGYLTQSMPSGSSISPFGALQQWFALQHQTTPVVPRHADGTFATWHSGMSPHKYEVVVLKLSVKNYYGCGSSFVDKYRRALFNLVVKHVDRKRRTVPGNWYTVGTFQIPITT